MDEPDVDGETALMEAARLGQESSVEALLLGGAAIERRDKEGCTALITAALSGDADCTRLLVGARPNFQLRCGGRTALIQAGYECAMKAIDEHFFLKVF